MIELQEVKKTYGSTPALDGVSLRVKEGEFFGLLGPNGAGKSTLMHILTGFIDADSGKVNSGSRAVQCGNEDWKRCIGFVPQHIALYDQLSAMENLRIFGSLYNLAPEDLHGHALHLLEAVQLVDRRTDKVRTFSGGMKRRLNLVAALLHRPKILFCDEPTVGVDPHSRNAIFEFLEELNSGGMTIIYTTHYMEEVQRLCNRIGIIDHGRIVAEGSLNELLNLLPYDEELLISSEAPPDSLEQIWEEFGQPVLGADGSAVLKIHESFRLSEFFARVEKQGMEYRHFRLKQPSLEAVFLHLTGRSLRD